MTVFTPASEDEAAAAVREARGTGRQFRIEGGGTRAGLGRPVDAPDVLRSAALVGITLQEPAELVIAARAGTPVRDIEVALAANGQMLPFEPMDHRALYGTGGEPTVGGLVATNASGPRRVASGAARDHLIGLRFVNGRGEAVKSGGRVMKNVTGLDLVKLECGAHGTLGFITEVTFKVLPVPEANATLAWSGLDDARGVALLSAALGSPFEVTGAAHLPAGPGRATGRTFVRVEGFSASVDYRCSRLAGLLDSYGTPERLENEASAATWTGFRDAIPPALPRENAVWRLSVPPGHGPGVVGRIGPLALDHVYDWGGGLITLCTAATDDASATAIRAAIASSGGHATLVRAPDAVRRTAEVFQPSSQALAGLEKRIRASIDPEDLFNPGRMTSAR